MNAIISNRTFQSLTKSEQDRLLAIIKKECDRVVDENINAHEEALQILMIKMCLIVMARSGATKEQLMLYLGNWKMTYHNYHTQFKKRNETVWLQEQLDAVLPGFDASEYLESLRG